MSPLQTFQLILGLLATALMLTIATRRLPLPPAAALVLGGMCLAVIPARHAFELDPELIMVLFLPPLLLSGAYGTILSDFREQLRPILLLAVGAVAFTTLLVGCAARWLDPQLPWAACFALGAIVSPPDAVSAKAVLRTLPLSRKLVTIIEGESLMNDAVGLLLYRFAVAAALTGVFQLGTAVLTLLWLAVGGAAFGLGAGHLTLWFTRFLKTPHEVVLLTFLAAWITYLVSDLLGVSGVLAVVFCGFVISSRQHEIMTARTRTTVGSVWRFMVTVFETLVFVLIGMSLRGVLDRFGGIGAALSAVGELSAVVVLTVILSRLLWVLPGIGLLHLRTARAEDPPPTWGAGLVVGWAGMRGVVSLAAALALPRNFPGRDTLLFATFAVIAVTVLLQGSTLAPLIRLLERLGAISGDARTRDEYSARVRLATASLTYLEALAAERTIDPATHAPLVDLYRQRLQMTHSVSEPGDASELRLKTRLETALAAIAAGRAELLRLHRGGEIHESVLQKLELELDLEELRLQQIGGQLGD
jgi:monovalent cation/hydrogen antiporter